MRPDLISRLLKVSATVGSTENPALFYSAQVCRHFHAELKNAIKLETNSSSNLLQTLPHWQTTWERTTLNSNYTLHIHSFLLHFVIYFQQRTANTLSVAHTHSLFLCDIAFFIPGFCGSARLDALIKRSTSFINKHNDDRASIPDKENYLQCRFLFKTLFPIRSESLCAAGGRTTQQTAWDTHRMMTREKVWLWFKNTLLNWCDLLNLMERDHSCGNICH